MNGNNMFNFTSYFILAIFIIAFTSLVALKYIAILSKMLFSNIYFRLCQTFWENIAAEKADLFKEMNEMKSSDEKLKTKGAIRILEIGVGPGNNFQFYPKQSSLVLLEPNPFFVKSLTNSYSRCTHLRLEKCIIGVAEDMSQIEDCSVDAVVATYVLCSVQDIGAVLKEIHRVLAPGGKFFFMEHGCGKRSFWQSWLQILVNPVWKILIDGCELVKDVLIDVENCEHFTNVTVFTEPVKNQKAIGMMIQI